MKSEELRMKSEESINGNNLEIKIKREKIKMISSVFELISF